MINAFLKLSYVINDEIPPLNKSIAGRIYKRSDKSGQSGKYLRVWLMVCL
jgi:hypothetical protein